MLTAGAPAMPVIPSMLARWPMLAAGGPLPPFSCQLLRLSMRCSAAMPASPPFGAPSPLCMLGGMLGRPPPPTAQRNGGKAGW